MTRLTVSPFAPAHYPRALEAAGIETPWIEDRLAHGRAYADGPSYTIWAGDRIACVLGLIIPWPGRATAWAFWTPAGLDHPGGVHRLTVRYLRGLIRQYRLLRLDAEVVADFDAGRRWLAHLGFREEGPRLRFYGPQGEDFQRYVWYHPRPADLALVRRLEPQEAMPEPARRPDGSVIPAISGGYTMAALAIVAVVATVAAAGVSAYAQYQQGQAQKKAYQYNAQVAENQAQIAKQQAEFAAKQQRERDRRLMARARAIQSVTGVEVGEGSSLLVDIDNARQAELNAAAARYETEARQRNILAGAGLQRFQGDVASQQGTFGAGATLLSGLGSAAGTGARYYGRSSMPSSPTPSTIQMPADWYDWG